MTVLREGILGAGVNLFFIYKFLRILTTPWENTDAFKLGIIDENGTILRKKRTLLKIEEKEAYTIMHRLVWKLKRLMEKVPFGKSRLASYAAALWLIKEEKSFHGNDKELQESFLSFLETNWKNEALILKENYEGDMNKKTYSNFKEDIDLANESFELGTQEYLDHSKSVTPGETVEIDEADTEALKRALAISKWKKAGGKVDKQPDNIEKWWGQLSPADRKRAATIAQYKKEKKAKKEEVEMKEGKSSTGYELYHKTFSDAMQHAYAHAKSKGFVVDPKEIDDKVATGPKKPSSGKTNRYSLKAGRKKVEIQVANLDNKRYELNMYIEGVILESTKEYAKSLEKIARDRQISILSKSDKTTLLKIAALLDKERKEEVEVAEAFKPHKMYDPKTGKEYDADTVEDHLKYKKMGYSHEKLQVESLEKEGAAEFMAAASAAKKEGKKKFKFGGKEYPVTIKVDIPLATEEISNSVGGGGIAGLDIGLTAKKKKEDTDKAKALRKQMVGEEVQRTTFAGKDVFIVDSDTFHTCRLGKKKYGRYETYVGDGEVGQTIREYGLKYPRRPIILQNGDSGPMLYLKYGRS